MLMGIIMPAVYRNQETQETNQQKARNNPHQQFTHGAKVN